jgi:alkanesulfonate monooxygenase SsuD/methylene tetrahydromethanopterin reductase-like flavin-dependent oxidoreductase (luciferase family)
MVGVPAFAAETDEHAEFLATSMYQRSLGIMRGRRTALQPPVKDMNAIWSQGEALAVADRMALMVVGGVERVRAGLQQIIDATQADELIIASDAYAFEDRLRSFETIALAAELPRAID